MVEVIVAALLLMFALAGLVPFFISSQSSASAIRYRSSASNIASERMEQIRQLDFREITDAAYLTTVFGDSESLRGIDFNISYGVETSTYGEGILKEITVTVDWDAPPKVVAASLTSMFHQQFVGPRISWLEVTGAEGEGAVGFRVDVTPPYPGWFTSLICLLPFAGVALLWLIGALRSRRSAAAVPPESERNGASQV